MNPHPLYRLTLLLALLGLNLLARAAPDPAELAQIQACRATSSLLVLRGEGFPARHGERLARDLEALADSVRSPVLQADETLQKQAAQLIQLLEQGRDYDPNDENMPWPYPKNLNRALNAFLIRAEQLGAAAPDLLAQQLEYLGVQYLSRAYIGDYEIPRELQKSYLGQDESSLTPSIQRGIEKRAASLSPVAARQLLSRWRYLKSALDDLNSQAASSSTRSGRPFVPMMVDRQTRLLSESLLAPGGS